MEIKPPEDYDVKNIIDKLANFVARNGVEFENMTKNKQKDNPKFRFLFGGADKDYYEYKLATERQIQNQQVQSQVKDNIMQQTIQNAPWQQSYNAPYNQSQLPPRGGMVPPWQQQQQPQQHPPLRPPHPYMQSQPRMQTPPQNMVPPASNVPQPLMMVPLQPTGLLKEESELEQEEKQVEDKISESENNLKQQYQSLMTQQQERIEQAITDAEENDRVERAEKLGLQLSSLDEILQPIIDLCTKDSIASGKTWILANSASSDHCVLIAKQLLHRVFSAGKTTARNDKGSKKSFTVQLHLVYLINDVLHHASRRNLDQLLAAIEEVITPIFCMAQTSAKDQAKETERLMKLLGLWNKFSYFNADTMQQLENPDTALKNFQCQRTEKHSDIVEKVKNDIQRQYESFEKQHQEYADHIKHQIEEKREAFERRKLQAQESEKDHYPEVEDKDSGSHRYEDQSYERHEPQSSSRAPSRWSSREKPISDSERDNDHGYDNDRERERFSRESDYQYEIGRRREREREKMGDDYDYEYEMERRRNEREAHPPPRPPPPTRERGPPPPEWRGDEKSDRWVDSYHGPPPPSNRPPFDGPPRGPPGGPPGGWIRRGPPGPRMGGPRLPFPEEALIPKAPYYDLPAGLMAPLVMLEDMEYKELDPARIRLPPPIPPNERLLAAVEAFYRPPSHDHPRNPDGWETNGLFEFFRAKVRAKRAYDRMKPSPTKSLSRSRSRSYSRSPSRSYSRSRSRSRSRERSRSYSRERTPAKDSPPRRSRSRSIDRTSPVNRARIDRTSPVNRARIDRTSPVNRSRIDRTSPVNRPRVDRTSPVNRSRIDRTSPVNRSRIDRTSPVNRSRIDRTSPVKRSIDRTSPVNRPRKDDAPTPPRHQLGRTEEDSANNGHGENNSSGGGRLSLDNPGAMMMKKMGWSGAGLGSKEQGIQDPVQAGEVRDNYDKFRGLGNDLKDPFETYRKSRSQGYINRIRKR